MGKKVILVEGNDFDIRLASDAIQEVAPQAKLHVIRDGEAALHALTRPRISAQLILLDLNIPRLDGMSILQEVQRRKATGLFPAVIVFSVNDDRETMAVAMRLGATAYFVKPSDPQLLKEKLRETLRFWLSTVESVTPDDGFDPPQEE